VLPRCFGDSPDAGMPADDPWAYQKTGEKWDGDHRLSRDLDIS
jgi:hypothetical protein